MSAEVKAGRIVASFHAQAWQRDYAMDVDPLGPSEWDATAFAATVQPYLDDLWRAAPDHSFVLDRDDVFRDDPAAPSWIREWPGPFFIELHRSDKGSVA